MYERWLHVCMHVDVWTLQHTFEGQSTYLKATGDFWEFFLPLWVLGTELKSMGFCGKCFSHWVISLAHISSIKTIKKQIRRKNRSYALPFAVLLSFVPSLHTWGRILACRAQRLRSDVFLYCFQHLFFKTRSL